MRNYVLIEKKDGLYSAVCPDGCTYVERELDLLCKIVWAVGFMPVADPVCWE